MTTSIRSRVLAAAATLALVATPLAQAEAGSHISNTGAAILGGIAGVAVGAAIVDNAHRNPAYYPPRYQPYPYPEPYPYAAPYPYAQPYPYPAAYPRPVYAGPFSPAPGVTCYPGRALCYNDNGTLARNWTGRVFDY